MVVVTKYSCFVTPSEPTPNDPLLLSDCDQSKVWSLTPTIYVYPPHNTSLFSFSHVVETLRVSLGRVLVPFYPLAGRLRWIGGGRLELECNAMGVEFVVAESDSTLEGFGGFKPTDKIKPLLPDIDYDLPIEELPAMSVRVTRFACGGITIGLAISHSLIDGKAAMHFIKSWTRLARGEALDESDMPFHDRSVFCGKDMYSSLDVPAEWKPLPLLLGWSGNEEEQEKETTVAEFKLTREQIRTLQCHANALQQKVTCSTKIAEDTEPMEVLHQKVTCPTKIGQDTEPMEVLPQKVTWSTKTSQNTKPTEVLHQKVTWSTKIDHNTEPMEVLHQESIWPTKTGRNTKPTEILHQKVIWPTKTCNKQRPYTTFEAVSAHVWRTACKARGHEHDQPTVHMLTVDCRNRVNPPLPKGYFGNAVIRTITDPNTVSGELASKPLSYAAGKIRESIQKFTSSYVESTLGFIRSQEDVSWTRASFHMAGSKLGQFLGNPNMIVASWIGLPTRDADFGWGKPSYMGPGALSSDGKCFIIPDCDEDGSLVIALRLQTPHIGLFEKYFYEGTRNTEVL